MWETLDGLGRARFADESQMNLGLSAIRLVLPTEYESR